MIEMSCEERNDFFVMRRPQIIKLTKETIHVISAKMGPNNDIDSEEVDYMTSNDFRTANNFSRVRIPSALFKKTRRRRKRRKTIRKREGREEMRTCLRLSLVSLTPEK